ncbi:hypothetical protein CDAR_46371 [Caerostris darwini]|uniref:Uncharacterized protein n=1 Tax=Caerostris darwini TaxID=1538125 RepID=A0AAV4PXF9_9ARAC|nr:hypothetical protein CDAR_46371 [Caerostris darwini]
MVNRKPKWVLTRLDNGGQTAIRRCRLEEMAKAAPNFPYDTKPLLESSQGHTEESLSDELLPSLLPFSKGGWQLPSAELGASLHVMVKRKPTWVSTLFDNGGKTAI